MTAKYIDELTALTAFSNDDQVIVEQADGTKRAPLQDAVNSVMNGRSVVREYLKIDGKNFISLKASTTTSKAALLSSVHALGGIYAALSARELDLEIRTIGSGSGGTWGGTGGYGGFGGIVRDRMICLDDLDDGDIPCVVGAGPASGGDGGATYFGESTKRYCTFSQSVKRGGNSDTEEGLMWSLSCARGLVVPLRIYQSTSSPWGTNDNEFGPGHGGCHNALRVWQGGASSTGRRWARVSTVATMGVDGADAIPDEWDSFGAGGAGNTSGYGGRGGNPGGGGGGSRSSQPTDATRGRGGDGEIRLRLSRRFIMGD